jgi:hypothetical protein
MHLIKVQKYKQHLQNILKNRQHNGKNKKYKSTNNSTVYFCHCAVCSSIYGSVYPFGYLQTLLISIKMSSDTLSTYNGKNKKYKSTNNIYKTY